jgi:hypothetical protein
MPKFSADIDLQKGQLINARAELLTALPVFLPGEDEGRFLFVTEGIDQGFWFGSTNGSAAFQRMIIGTQNGQYDLVDSTIGNGATTQVTLSSTLTPSSKGFTAKVQITSSTNTSGQVRLELYEDTGRTTKFYDAVFDMADQAFIDRVPSYFELDNTDGDVYVDVTNLTGGSGDFTVSILTSGVLPVITPPPPGDGSGVNDAVSGDGLTFNVTFGRIDVELTAGGGLQMVGAEGLRTLQIFVNPTGGIITDGSGAAVDPDRVPIGGTDQTTPIAGTKLFTNMGWSLDASPGPPTTGDHEAGELYRDSLGDLYECITTGTPGIWQFYGWKEARTGGATDASSYVNASQGLSATPVTVSAAGGTAVLEVVTAGRRGWIRKMNIWSGDPARGTVDIDSPYRITCYPNENLEGREQLWAVIGQARKTYTTDVAGHAPGSTTIEINNSDIANLDDLVRLHQISTPLEEYQRVVVRRSAPVEIDFDETTVNALAQDDQVYFVTEFINLPWRNNSGVGAESQKIFLEFVNDDPTQDLIFGVDILVEEVGGGAPVT